MSARLRFETLTARQQDQARARFFDARPGDGYLYELLPDGCVLCRRRAPKDPDEGDYVMCRWVQDDEGSDLWGTGCKRYFVISEGTPSDNSMEYCCYCGKPLEEAPWEEEVDDAFNAELTGTP